MIILPAIDIKGGECVRLVKGDYSTAQKVIESPYLAAQRFADAGANWMHMVDLDGAKDAKLVNADLIADVAKSSGLSVEVGGGIRDMKAVEYYLSHGINRVILGSAAVKDQQFVIDAVNTFGNQIVIGIDAKDGMVRAEGWLDNSDINYIELAKRMEDVGVKTIVFTDIEQDGTLAGPNLKQLDSLIKSVSCNIIASGGVAVLKDIKNLIELNAYGAICGKSIYSGSLDLRQAIETTRNS
ncbi:MAG: 1-(5-phosphoribosyl)-5-[(5-phosphoribosylamino)methylideneamino]imidazole-4-carboxamide isomerase [Ruminococcus bromii]|nr:1-(5-phosphoribosyl)-5-[(5-phosphoribosylamino)methylideneamino]imidazole-4-carboxamide isomerase [Ruminococcus bromii]